MATLLDILGGLSPQGAAPKKQLNLAPTPAQKNFDPDEQAIRELLLTLGADVAADQSPAFLAPAAPTPVDTFVDEPRRMAPNVEQGLLGKILGFPGAGSITEDSTARRAEGGFQRDPLTPDIGNELIATFSSLLEGADKQEVLGGLRAEDTAAKVAAFAESQKEGTIPSSAFGGPPTQEPQVPPLLARPEEQTPETLLGTTIDSLVKPTEGEAPIIPKLEEVAAPEDVTALLEGTATPEAKTKAKDSFFNSPGMSELMLGLGIGLLQGKNTGDALAMGVSMMQRANAAGVQAKGKEALEAASLAKTKAETNKLVAETTKIGREAGLDAAPLKGFRQTFKTLVGEQGIGDDVGTLRAQAQAAQTELAGAPTSAPLKKIRDDSVKGILTFISDLEDTEEQQEEIGKLKQAFGDKFIQDLIDNF